jgi:hypothetical protein
LAIVSLPFAFDYIEYIFLEEFSEILSCHAYVNIVVDLNGNTHAVALSYAKASDKRNVVVDSVIGNCFLHKLDYIGRSLKMTGATDANLNYYHKSNLCRDLFIKEFANGFRGYRIELIVYCNAYSLLTFAHAKSSAKLYLISELVLGNKSLKLLNYLTRTFDMT